MAAALSASFRDVDRVLRKIVENRDVYLKMFLLETAGFCIDVIMFPFTLIIINIYMSYSFLVCITEKL